MRLTNFFSDKFSANNATTFCILLQRDTIAQNSDSLQFIKLIFYYRISADVFYNIVTYIYTRTRAEFWNNIDLDVSTVSKTRFERRYCSSLHDVHGREGVDTPKGLEGIKCSGSVLDLTGQ